jgi:hypothetical protein
VTWWHAGPSRAGRAGQRVRPAADRDTNAGAEIDGPAGGPQNTVAVRPCAAASRSARRR